MRRILLLLVGVPTPSASTVPFGGRVLAISFVVAIITTVRSLRTLTVQRVSGVLLGGRAAASPPSHSIPASVILSGIITVTSSLIISLLLISFEIAFAFVSGVVSYGRVSVSTSSTRRDGINLTRHVCRTVKSGAYLGPIVLYLPYSYSPRRFR